MTRPGAPTHKSSPIPVAEVGGKAEAARCVRVRHEYTVYCETCQQHFAKYVLGRGYEPYGRKQAEQRAADHRLESGHIVTVKEKA